MMARPRLRPCQDCASGWRPCTKRPLTSRPGRGWKTTPCASSTTSICTASHCARTRPRPRRDHAWAGAGRPALQGDAAYCKALQSLGALYLENGPCLLHGDFYPGSWVRAGGGVWIIDPEFCFFGPPEFDVGILVGHLLLAGRPLELAQSVFAHYGANSSLSHSLALQFAGMGDYAAAHRRGSVAAGCGSVAHGGAVGDLAGVGVGALGR